MWQYEIIHDGMRSKALLKEEDCSKTYDSSFMSCLWALRASCAVQASFRNGGGDEMCIFAYADHRRPWGSKKCLPCILSFSSLLSLARSSLSFLDVPSID